MTDYRRAVDCDFLLCRRWSDRLHGKTSETFIVWVEDPESNFMYHHEYFILQRKQVRTAEVHFTRFRSTVYPISPGRGLTPVSVMDEHMPSCKKR